jgi:hypothetical protein
MFEFLGFRSEQRLELRLKLKLGLKLGAYQAGYRSCLNVFGHFEYCLSFSKLLIKVTVCFPPLDTSILTIFPPILIPWLALGLE